VSQNLNIINTLGHSLTDNELAQAITILVEARKTRQQKQLLTMKNTLDIGDRVEWYSSLSSSTQTGTVVKTKTKKAIVEEDNMRTKWDIPMGMLKKING
jgi:hypothetical protein